MANDQVADGAAPSQASVPLTGDAPYDDSALPSQTVTLSTTPPDGRGSPASPMGQARRLAGARSTRWVRWLVYAVAGACLLGVSGLLVQFALHGAEDRTPQDVSHPSANNPSPPDDAPEAVSAIPVNTVFPSRKTLVRTLEQPGSIVPFSQAELYAKTSGYVKTIQRDWPPLLAAEIAAERACCGPMVAVGPGAVAPLLVQSGLAIRRAPAIDIGSFVQTDEVLLEIAVPELFQDIAQKEAQLQLRKAELEQARTAIATAEAAIQAVVAQKKQAEADVRRAISEHTFQVKQLHRLEELAGNRTVTRESVDEKQNQVNAAAAALQASQAKVEAVQAEIATVSSKLAGAQADLMVKTAQVNVAKAELERARQLAEYAVLRAPFDGIITYRGVDEGDFVQNSTSGQTRLLMTITAIDQVKVVLQIPERDARWVQQGTTARVHFDGREEWQVAGQVARTSHSLDTASRTMRVEVDLDNADHRLLPGMYGQVTLTLQRMDNVLAIPATAVYSRKGENYLIQVLDGVAHRQRVRIRFDDGHEVAVVKLMGDQEIPLDGSEELIVSNKGEISEGQRVKAVPLAAP